MRMKAKNRLEVVERRSCFSLTGKHPCGEVAAWEVRLASGEVQYLCDRHYEVAREVMADVAADDMPVVRRV